MKNKMFLISNVCMTALVCAPLVAFAAEKKSSSPAASASASPAASPAKQSARPVPFHGMVSAVDQKAKTFTIAGKDKSRVFKVTDKTALTKAGQPAKMTDITENVEVSGSYWNTTMEAKTVKIGPMGTGEKATDKSKKTAALPSPSPKASPKSTPKPY
jgi:hypothetical protein